MIKRLVLIESPYAADRRRWMPGFLQRWANRRYARACVRDSLLRGEAPIASHLLYTQAGILRDGIPEERRRGIDAGLAWLRRADLSAVYIDRGITRGMDLGIEAAMRAGVEVNYRTLDYIGGSVRLLKKNPRDCPGGSAASQSPDQVAE